MSTPQPSLEALRAILPQIGTVNWIGLRPGRKMPLQSVQATTAAPGEGLDGDRFANKPQSKRQVTLIQGEHLDAVAAILGQDQIDPVLTRRNIVVRGINLMSLEGKRFRIGDAVLEGTGPCEPCSRMEENLGPGGYNAMTGHGGLCTRVIEAGAIRVGDEVKILEN